MTRLIKALCARADKFLRKKTLHLCQTPSEHFCIALFSSVEKKENVCENELGLSSLDIECLSRPCCKAAMEILARLVWIKDKDFTLESFFEPDRFADDVSVRAIVKRIKESLKEPKVIGLFKTDQSALCQSTENNDKPHIHVKIPKCHIMARSTINKWKSKHGRRTEVLNSILGEYPISSIKTTLDMLESGKLFGGHRYSDLLTSAYKHKLIYDELPDPLKNNFIWALAIGKEMSGRWFGTPIPRFLEAISNPEVTQEDMKHIVDEYHVALMIEMNEHFISSDKEPRRLLSEQYLTEHGYKAAFHRKLAHPDDIPKNVALYTRANNARNALCDAKPRSVDDLSYRELNIETIEWSQFEKTILKTAKSIEIRFDLVCHTCSIIAPQDQTSKQVFVWQNLYSWSFRGGYDYIAHPRYIVWPGENLSLPKTEAGRIRITVDWYTRNDLALEILAGDGLVYHQKSFEVIDNVTGVDHRELAPNKSPRKAHHRQMKFEAEISDIFAVRVITLSTVEPGAGVDIAIDYLDQASSSGRKIRLETEPVRYDQIDEKFPVYLFTITRWPDLYYIRYDQPAAQDLGLIQNTFYPVEMILPSPNHWDQNKNMVGLKYMIFTISQAHAQYPQRTWHGKHLIPELKPLELNICYTSPSFVDPNQSGEGGTADREVAGIGFNVTNQDSGMVVRVRDYQDQERMYKIKFTGTEKYKSFS